MALSRKKYNGRRKRGKYIDGFFVFNTPFILRKRKKGRRKKTNRRI
jgi:hypothetical protein